MPPALRSRIAIVAALAGALQPSPARGSAEPVELDIQCATLGGPDRAQLDARARATLLARGVATGRFMIACGAGRARISWRAADGRETTRTLALPADPAELAEALLSAIDELTASSRFPVGGAAQPTGPDASAPNSDAAPPSSESAGGRSDHAGSPPSSPAAKGWALGLLLGAAGAYWVESPALVLGPRAGLALTMPFPMVLSATAGREWAVGAPEVVSIEVTRIALGADLRVGRSALLELGLGGAVDFLRVSVDPELAPRARSTVKPAFWVRGRFTPSWHGHRVAFGPEVRFHPAPDSASVDGEEVFRVPVVALGLGLDVILQVLEP